jgi:regulation of enolase protein 1 (concanavalin A-like superfamily)
VHVPQTLQLPQTLEVGTLALRNGGTGFARATFTHIGLSRLPDGWTGIDVGAVGAPGRSTQAAGVWQVSGGGVDLWGTADATQFAYRAWTGDVDFVARVQGITAPPGSTFALAGLSIRESLAPNARHGSIIITTQGKAKFRRRLTVGGTTYSDGPTTGSITTPIWLRLRRSGQTISAYTSRDGVTWQAVHTSVSVPLSSAVYVGIVGLRSGTSGVGEARVDSVTLR